MARRRRYQPIARIRRALLLALIVFTGAFVGYYLTGRLSSNGGQSDAPGAGSGLSVREGLLTVAHGFDYEVTDGDALAFRVRAEKLISDIEDKMELDQVQIEMPRDEGDIVTVVADRGTIHLDSNSATLEGAVRAVTEDGVELRGESFEVVRDGRQLVSRSPVTFGKQGEYQGAARQLTYSLKKERLTLEGNVVIEGEAGEEAGGSSVRCKSLTYDRVEGTLRLEGDVQLVRGQEFMNADRLSLTLGEDEGDIRFVRAENGVSGRYLPEPTDDDLRSRVDFSGRLLYAAFEEGTQRAKQAELRGRARQLASFDVVDESGLSRVVSAPVVLADFEDGEVSGAEAYEPVEIVERLAFAPGQPLRRLCADRATVLFDELGELRTLTLDGYVDYQTVDMQAQGDRIVARGIDESITMVGRPALAMTEQGDLQAPKITYLEGGGLVAEDGVRAELRETGGTGLMGGASDEPLRVTSSTARWQQDPDQVTFEGTVRAWQGRDYLLADEMVGEPESDRLTASGDVRTVFTPQAASGRLGSGDGDELPITITAKEMLYERRERVINYDGRAKAVQANRTLECAEMDVMLDAGDEFDRLVCTGDLRIDDPDQGKKVKGDAAVYVPADDEVDVTGDPVVLTDRDGTELRGGRILYRFDTGTARIRSRPDPDSVAEDRG